MLHLCIVLVCRSCGFATQTTYVSAIILFAVEPFNSVAITVSSSTSNIILQSAVLLKKLWMNFCEISGRDTGKRCDMTQIGHTMHSYCSA